MCESFKSENNRAIQQLIDLLIGDDPETDDLRETEVPDAHRERLEKLDAQDAKDIEEYQKANNDTAAVQRI